MKFLSFPALDKASTTLEGIDLGDIVLTGKLEAYSCKRAGEDKKLQKIISERIQEDIAQRLKRGQSLDTPMGPLDSPVTQRLLAFMITTLNASFPDYDFSSLTADCFEKLAHRNAAIDSINMSILKPVSGVVPGFQGEVWQAVTEAIDPTRCEALSLVIDPDVMIFAMNKLWTMCYFFYNPSLKRIMLFFCAAKSKLSLPSNQLAGNASSGRIDDEDSKYSDSLNHHHHHHHPVDDEDVNESMRSNGEEQFDLMEEESEFGDVSDDGDDDEDLGIGGTGSAVIDPAAADDASMQSNAGLNLGAGRASASASALAAAAQRGGGAIVDVAMLDWDDADTHRTVLFLPDLPHLAPTFVPRASNPANASNTGSHTSTPTSTAASPALVSQASGGSGSGVLAASVSTGRVPALALAAQASLTRIRPVNPVVQDRWPKRIEIDDEIKSPHTFSQRFGSNPPPISELPAAAMTASGGSGTAIMSAGAITTAGSNAPSNTSSAHFFPMPKRS